MSDEAEQDTGDELEQLQSEGASPTLDDRLTKLEADLIAQDHRAIPVLRTFFAERRRWSRSDPRWSASWTAFLWWCVGSVATPAGAAVGLAAFLTLALTGWNAWEFRRQNETLAEQNTTLKRQVDQQEADNRVARRAQLVATIYEEDCTTSEAEGDDPPEKVCVPRSHIRARQEAVLAFVEIERRRDARPDLSGVDLRGANLFAADLSGVNLAVANLSGANLSGVNLGGANLSAADLDTVLLTQEQVNRAFGDSETILPENLIRPEHWTAGQP